MKIRQGTDITNVRRIQESIERHGDHFLNRIFTSAERSYCESKRMKYEHYAARFAAKEAVMKAVEVKKKDRFRFREIEVKRHATGKPHIHLSGHRVPRKPGAREPIPGGRRAGENRDL